MAQSKINVKYCILLPIVIGGDTPFLYECINKHLCYPNTYQICTTRGGRCHFVTVIEYIHPIFERVRQ